MRFIVFSPFSGEDVFIASCPASEDWQRKGQPPRRNFLDFIGGRFRERGGTQRNVVSSRPGLPACGRSPALSPAAGAFPASAQAASVPHPRKTSIPMVPPPDPLRHR